MSCKRMKKANKSKRKQARSSGTAFELELELARCKKQRKPSRNPAQTHPKSPQNLLQTPPRAPQERPRAFRSAHEHPRARQERPTSVPRAPQERPRAPECCQNPLQDLPKWSPNRYKNKFLRVFVACVFQHEFSIHFLRFLLVFLKSEP